ncbi:hypothetical protein BASA62_004339 [Batrachochytrium salamandrivorans]|nr:hypothetical protein BASA62_004339 [Batrachochytrium salamandrivorans]
MQFFHLFSFVVVASYAAALPQPAGLSEKYSNNVDTNLASGLEARSYQPESNSYKESATLTLLKTTEPSTIGKVVNNDYIFLLEGEIAAHKIGDPVKEVMAKYFKMCAYVDSAIEFWLHKSAPHILDLIKSGLGEDKYFEVGPELTETRKTVTDDLRAGYTKISSYIVKIVKDVSSVIDSLQKIDKLFKDAFYSSIDFIRRLRLQLLRFQIDETLEVALVNIIEAINDFIIMQTNLLEEIMKGLDAASSQ